MRLRSLLFVPGDRPERFAKAEASGADAVILDLEDSVAIEAKGRAREAVAARLAGAGEGVFLMVRVNPAGSPFFEDDMRVAMMADAIVLPKAEGAPSLDSVAVAVEGHCPPILPIATETPAAVFALGSFASVGSQLCGLSWGAEDLPAAIGAETAREADGRYTPPYEVARALTLFAAHAAGVPAIETVYPDFRDEAGLAAYAARGARDGFTGMLAIHPGQVAAINAAFAPSERALAEARAIVAAFAAEPGKGALQIDGRMIDRPHLVRARALLARAGEQPETEAG